MNSRQTLGQRGEAFVAAHLQRAGCAVIERNWRRAPLGELDIVAREGASVVFVEVRTRRGPLTQAVEAALESVGAAKRARLLALAQAYLAEHDLEDAPWRVDLAAVACERGALALEIIPDALTW